jgi:hypothetical protein
MQQTAAYAPKYKKWAVQSPLQLIDRLAASIEMLQLKSSTDRRSYAMSEPVESKRLV